MPEGVYNQGSRLSDGKSLFSAILLTGAGAVLIFILSKVLIVDQDFAGSIYENGVPRALAGVSMLAFPYIHQRLAGKRHPNFSHLPDGPVPMEAYTLPGYLILAYGVLLSFAIAGTGLLLVWLVGQASGIFITRAIPVLPWIILPITFYYFGSWAGTRNTQRPFLLSLAIPPGYILLEILVTFTLKIDFSLQSILGATAFLILSALVAMAGARTGRWKRISRYTDFLLHLLTESERKIVLKHLYQEVHRQTNEDKELSDTLGETIELDKSAFY